MLEILIFLVIC